MSDNKLKAIPKETGSSETNTDVKAGLKEKWKPSFQILFMGMNISYMCMDIIILKEK